MNPSYPYPPPPLAGYAGYPPPMPGAYPPPPPMHGAYPPPPGVPPYAAPGMPPPPQQYGMPGQPPIAVPGMTTTSCSPAACAPSLQGPPKEAYPAMKTPMVCPPGASSLPSSAMPGMAPSPMTGYPMPQHAGMPGYNQTISLVKGQQISLSKQAPGLRRVFVGCGWDVQMMPGGQPIDLDLSIFCLQDSGLTCGNSDFIFYNNKSNSDGSVILHADNRTGLGEGDDEMATLELWRVPAHISRIVFVASIYDAQTRCQTFGNVNRAFIRVVNLDTGMEICRYDMTQQAGPYTALAFAEVYRDRYTNEWKFTALGQGYQGGLSFLTKMFGVNAV